MLLALQQLCHGDLAPAVASSRHHMVNVWMVQLFTGKPSQSYGASSALWDHTVLPATRHRLMRSTSTPAR